MVKKLPSVKKGLKEFILDEDAKVIDRTATKIAITGVFLAINFLGNADDANAKGHSDHSNHQNNLNAPLNYGTGIHAGTNPTEVGVNQIEQKSVQTMHANHYNHQDKSGGGQGGFGMILGMVAAIAISFMISPGGASLFSQLATNLGGKMAGNILAGAIIGGAGAIAGGVAEEMMMGGGEEGGGDINVGSPHQIPEPILRALQDEEK